MLEVSRPGKWLTVVTTKENLSTVGSLREEINSLESKQATLYVFPRPFFKVFIN
jgi:hypothetical protein